MERLRTKALTVLIAVLSLALTISPGFGQSGTEESESRVDFLSGAGQTILAASGGGAVSSGAAVSSSSDGGGSPTLVYSSSAVEILAGPNVRVNAAQILPGAGFLGRSETTIAASEDGRNLVAGWNDAQGFCGPPFGVACTPQSPSGLSGFGFSTNSGATWTDGGAPNPALGILIFGIPVFTRGDPWLDRGGLDRRTFFYANLAVHAVTGATLGVSVHRGHFNNSSFSWENVRVFNAPNPNDFYDKEAIAVDKRGRGLGYVSLTNFIELCNQPAFGFGQIEVWRTMNGGDTWLGPTIVNADITFDTNPASPTCGFFGVLQQSSVPVIGPDGEVYVIWQRGPTFIPPFGIQTTDADIVVGRSLNGGVTFDPPVNVKTINSLRSDPPVGYNRRRINDHPRIAVDQGNRFKGRIYAVFASAVAPVAPAGPVPCPAGTPPPSPPATLVICEGQNLTSSQIFVSYSDNRGLTWSTPQAVAPAPPAQGVKRLWPVVDVLSDGNIAVVYYQSQETFATPTIGDTECNVSLGIFQVGPTTFAVRRRAGERSSLVNTFLVVGTPERSGSVVFSPPLQVTTATSNWCTALFNIRPNFGDYIGSTGFSKGVLPVWADSRSGPVDTFFSRVEVKGRTQVGGP